MVDYMGIDRSEQDCVSFISEHLDRLDAMFTVLQQYVDQYKKPSWVMTEEDRVNCLNLG